MGKPSQSEIEALDQAGPLLRFSAENAEDLDESLALSIAKAQEARATDTWTPEMSQKFWATFHMLCRLIRPVTVDCLSVAEKNAEALNLLHFRREKVSLARRSSDRYLWLLFASIALSVPFQLYVWVCAIESKAIDDLNAKIENTYANLSAQAKTLDAELILEKSSGKAQWSDPNETKENYAICDGLNSLDYDLSRVKFNAGILADFSITPLKISPRTADISKCYTEYWTAFNSVENIYRTVKAEAAQAQVIANLESGIVLSFLLPVLFGLIGAIAYVVREISKQIQNTTFSRTSPIRHLMRATLGALAGLVVGLFSNLSNKISLPPLALAFLAGYGVESLFSMFDGIIAKFRQS